MNSYSNDLSINIQDVFCNSQNLKSGNAGHGFATYISRSVVSQTRAQYRSTRTSAVGSLSRLLLTQFVFAGHSRFGLEMRFGWRGGWDGSIFADDGDA